MELGKAARWHRIRMSKESRALNMCGHHLSVSGWLMKRIASPVLPSAPDFLPSFAVWRERAELGIRNIEKMNHSLGRNDVHRSKSALGWTQRRSSLDGISEEIDITSRIPWHQNEMLSSLIFKCTHPAGMFIRHLLTGMQKAQAKNLNIGKNSDQQLVLASVTTLRRQKGLGHGDSEHQRELSLLDLQIHYQAVYNSNPT